MQQYLIFNLTYHKIIIKGVEVLYIKLVEHNNSVFSYLNSFNYGWCSMFTLRVFIPI